MQCYRCGCKPVESKRAFFPIDPKGENRRWSCEDCMSEKEVSQVPGDVKDIVNVLQGVALSENKETKQYADSDFSDIDKDEIIFQLWRIIDNIDTFGDMAKSDDKAFRDLTEREQRKRWIYATPEYVDHVYNKYYDRSCKNGSPKDIESTAILSPKGTEAESNHSGHIAQGGGSEMIPKHSKPDSRGMMFVACSECQRGGNGDQSCSSGWQVKRGGPEKGACFSGKLLEKYSKEAN